MKPSTLAMILSAMLMAGMAHANSGQADRYNEARSYPQMTSSQTTRADDEHRDCQADRRASHMRMESRRDR